MNDRTLPPILLLLAFATAACGYKGPLTLPPKSGPVVTRPAPTPQATAPATTSPATSPAPETGPAQQPGTAAPPPPAGGGE